MSQILDTLQRQQSDMIATLEQWVNQDSPTHTKPAVDAMGQLTVSAFVEAGAELVETFPQPELGNHYKLAYGTGSDQILILCHFDTVWPPGEATRRPFAVENGVATGPGVHDMKGGTVIALFALKALRQLELRPRHRLVFMFNSDEEIGSPTSTPLIRAEGKQSRYCLVMEGSHNKSMLTTARKGIGRYHLAVQGVAAHAGVEPQKGVSAIEELARQIQALHAMTNFEQGVTVNVGQIAGGSRPNVIAGQATAEIDLRVTTLADGEQYHRQIIGLKPYLTGCNVSISGKITRPPFEESAAGLALFDKAQAIAERLGFSVEKYHSGGGSDGNTVAALGVPTLDGLGTLGGGAHALSEHIIIDALPRRAALLAELILHL